MVGPAGRARIAAVLAQAAPAAIGSSRCRVPLPFAACRTSLGAVRRRVASAGDGSPAPYELEPVLPHFGAYVWGFSLDGTEPLPQEIVERIKQDMRHHRLLIFKGQGRIGGGRQVQITEELGSVESTFDKHRASPHPDIFRVSNDESEGCTNIGRTGWHIDGTFREMPFKYQTMHFHSVCEGGETWFVPLREFYEMQDEDTRAFWDRLWMVARALAHPLVYVHPDRGDTTMLFHCGPKFCKGWLVDDEAEPPARRRVASALPRRRIVEELTAKLHEAVDRIGVRMQWEVGDFAINDNLGNCHYAAPGTQAARRNAGLRILHRTTVAGETRPTKGDGRSTFLAAAL